MKIYSPSKYSLIRLYRLAHSMPQTKWRGDGFTITITENMETRYFEHLEDARRWQAWLTTGLVKPSIWMLDGEFVEFAVGTEPPVDAENDWLEMTDEVIADWLEV